MNPKLRYQTSTSKRPKHILQRQLKVFFTQLSYAFRDYWIVINISYIVQIKVFNDKVLAFDSYAAMLPAHRHVHFIDYKFITNKAKNYFITILNQNSLNSLNCPLQERSALYFGFDPIGILKLPFPFPL